MELEVSDDGAADHKEDTEGREEEEEVEEEEKRGKEEKMESDGGGEDEEAPGSVGIQCPTPAVSLKEPAMVSAFLRPLIEMTKEELIEICTNLEIALSLKDQEIHAINQHYEHILELYYNTADSLAVRNNELLSCQDHLKEAQSCLEQWRTEILRNQTGHQARQSVVSDSVLLEARRASMVHTPPSRPTEPAKKNDNSVDNKREDLDNPKRVSRRLNQSMDLHNKTRITPVLHRRKSSRTKNGESRPVPKPRLSVSRGKAEEDAGHSDTSEEMVKTCLDPDLLKDLDLGVTSPLRMSYQDDPTKVDILQIEEDRPMSSSSDSDTLLPSVREKCPVGDDDDDKMDTDTLNGSYEWSSFDDRPRTDCGRPLTGERRPDVNDRPPTRTGGRSRDVAASYSFEGHRPHPDSPIATRSTIENVAVKNGQNNQPRKPKIIFKEIKSEENNTPIRRAQTPHVRRSPKPPHQEIPDGVA